MTSGNGSMTLSFQSTQFDLVEHINGETWLRGSQVGDALGYEDAARSVGQLFDRNAAEFTDKMTALVKLPTAGGVQEVRIFSLRGAHLLGMFARTERAAEFRRWVLDVLEHQTAPPLESLPPPVAAEEVLMTLRRVMAERDTLRELMAWRLLKEQPHLRKVMYYYGIPGLSHTECARLMGWKTTTEWFRCLKLLAALGLGDYSPDPKRSAHGRSNMAKAQLTMAERNGSPAKPGAKIKLTKPQNMRPGQPPEHMAKMRAARNKKAGAA